LYSEAESSQEEALRQVSPSFSVKHNSLADEPTRAKPVQLFAIPGIDSSSSTSSSDLFSSTKRAGIFSDFEKSEEKEENSDGH